MICVPILAKDNKEAIDKMAKAAPYADLLELRLDSFVSFDLPSLVSSAPLPLIVTYRSIKEGGFGRAPYSARIRHLSEAVSLGVPYVDLEYSIPLEYRAMILTNRADTKIIISKHIRHNTPTLPSLKRWLQKLVATGADVVKVVTMATAFADNIRILELIPMAKQLAIPIIAFCMGEQGRISRVASICAGGLLTFASMDQNDLSAPGQIPVKEMRRLVELLHGCG